MEFKHLAALIPEIEEANSKFEATMQTVKTNEDVDKAADEYNKVLLKAIEAIYQDTKHVNSRETLMSVFGRVHDCGLTYFGGNPYVRLKKVVETGSIRHL